jgi:hypothetical protein
MRCAIEKGGFEMASAEVVPVERHMKNLVEHTAHCRMKTLKIIFVGALFCFAAISLSREAHAEVTHAYCDLIKDEAAREHCHSVVGIVGTPPVQSPFAPPGTHPPEEKVSTAKIAAGYLAIGEALIFTGACHFKVNMPLLIKFTSVIGLDQDEVLRIAKDDVESLKTNPEHTCKVAYQMLDAVGAIIY